MLGEVSFKFCFDNCFSTCCRGWSRREIQKASVEGEGLQSPKPARTAAHMQCPLTTALQMLGAMATCLNQARHCELLR
jgi:hypothetical protein